MSQPVFEIVHPSFIGDGNHEELIVWVKAPARKDVESIVEECGQPGTEVNDLGNGFPEDEVDCTRNGVDYFLPRDADLLRAWLTSILLPEDFT
jgi:hypothetical protein